MKTVGLLSNFGDVDEFDFFFDHELMGMLCHAYLKIIAKNDKKPSRHFIRSEAFVNENLFIEKDQATELTRF